ncbi:C40 family peptidase [Streptomyces sp. NPDC000229]|uniref:C40 family peptidase n=1 Tax=Streptomyces sp. NPDC000229 TaxID=3154247 RepID=UPI0033176B17
MPALASHRKPRTTRTLQTLHAHSPAVGVTTAAALASVTLLSSQSATAAPGAPGDPDRGPTVEEVQRKVDDLYRQAGTATQQYKKAKEATDQQRRRAGGMLDDTAGRTDAGRTDAGRTDVARTDVARTDVLNESRRTLGGDAATQYRSGGPAPTASVVFPDAPQALVDGTRLTDHRHETLTDHRSEQAEAAEQRAEAMRKLESLTASQASLRTTKQAVQRKLGEARVLLARLTAEERARAEAAEARTRHELHQEQPQHQPHQPHPPEAQSPPTPQPQPQPHPYPHGHPEDDSGYTAKAREVLAFAEAQIGKPYVWGATGPSSYDCSGLTQAAWRAAGVDLPRTAWEQVWAGTRVATEDLRPGDLVFFHDDISHVGVYRGDGRMIHAPRPGEVVREESIHYMPIHSCVRPA